MSNIEYGKLVTYENVKKVLYVLILMAIYEMIDIALLWYDLFYPTLSDFVLELNPY